jgi:hypothetical protein
MLTFFSTPKPFRGNIDVTQRNALRSWTLVHPEAEVILFGDDEGAGEAARELGIRHEHYVPRNEHGTKYLAPMYDRAQEIARHDVLCYVNCDVVFTSDFRDALERVREWRADVLMIGRRWDLDIAEPLEFGQVNWESPLRALALQRGRQRPSDWIDYFVFSRGLYHKKIPPFVIGRPGWDNWLVWYARAAGACVVDASKVVVAVHQNHDYSYHPDGKSGVWQGEEAKRNRELRGGWAHYGTIENATHRLTEGGIERNHRHWLLVGRRGLLAGVRWSWYWVLGRTRPMRHALGLRRGWMSSFFLRRG